MVNRRTTLFGMAGVAGGGLLSYRTFFADNEPAFADGPELTLSGNDIEINTVDGNVQSVFLKTESSDIEFSYQNFQESVIDEEEEEFEVTLELTIPAAENDHVDDDVNVTIVDTSVGTDDLPTGSIDKDVDELINEDKDGFGYMSGNLEITSHDDIDVDIFEPDMDDEDPGASRKTELRFDLTVRSTSYDEMEDVTLKESDDVEIDVTVTTLDPEDEDDRKLIDVDVGGEIELGGVAENDPHDD